MAEFGAFLGPQIQKIASELEAVQGAWSWHWFATCFIAAAITTLLFSPRLDRSFKRLKAHFRSKRARAEAWLDTQFILMNLILDPLKLAFGGAFIFGLSLVISENLQPVLKAHVFKTPLIEAGEFWGPVLGVALMALLLDFSYYLYHWFAHRFEVLWSLHAVHHRATYLTPLTKFRIHPLEDILDLIHSGIVVGVGLSVFQCLLVSSGGIPWMMGAQAVYIFNHFLGHLRHSHFWLSYGPWLSYVFVSPAMHQIHHSQNPKHFGKNLGIVFSFWDLCFGTMYVPKKREFIVPGPGMNEPRGTRTLLQEMVGPLNEIWRKLSRTQQKALPKTSDASEPSKAA